VRPGRRVSHLLVLIILLASGCQTTTPTSEPGATGGSSEAPGSSQGSASGTGAPGTAVASSEDLIAAALAAGTISFEESLVDRALALFNSPGLPDAFRSSESNLDAGTALFADIEAAQSTLSSDATAKLAPFMARPSDPTSIFSAPKSARAGGVVLAADTTAGWKSLPAADGAARVWVPDSVGADLHLRQHAADVSKVWVAYEDVFTFPDADAPGLPNATVNPDAAVDFYFIEAGDLDPRRPDCSDPTVAECSLASLSAAGFARSAEARRGNAASAYFVLDAGQGGDAALFELAHEIAHGGQFHYDTHEAPWLAESTANWVAYRVFQKLGLPPEPAYGWLPALFADPGTSLTSEGNDWSYRAWLYFQFAAMQRGDAIVASIWADAGKAGAQGAQAVDDVFPFADHFADFAVRNWNQEPVPNRYKSAPDATFPELQPSIRKDTPALKAGDKIDLDVALPHLASAYFSFGFDPGVRKITFDNTLAGLDGAHVWAMKQIDGTWHEPEDWTADGTKKFCRDNAAENLSKLVIIVSYSSVVGDLDAGGSNPKVSGAAAACGDWKGTMTQTRTWNNSDGHGSSTATFDGIWTLDETQTSGRCSLSAAFCAVYLPTGTITWEWHSHWTPGCQEDKAGTVPAGDSDIVTRQMLFLSSSEDPSKLSYWGSGVFLNPTKLSCPDPISAGAGPGAYFDLSNTASSANPRGGYNETCNSTTWEIDATATTITGSCYSWNIPSNTQLYEWNLTRIGPPPG
jgi:hypothetical protein